jgi:hypothetical protein
VATQQIEIRAVDKTQATLGKVNRSLGNIDKKAKDVSISFGQIAALAGSVFAGLGLAKVTSNLVTTGKELENLNVRLKFLFGSAKEGGKAFDEMAQFASQVPFSLEEIQKGAGVLSVVSDDAEELAKIMRITGNVAAVTGLDFKTASEQVQRSLSAGIASADLFREKGVRDMLGFSAGATVSAEETAEAFERVFGPGGKFAGATDALAGTLEGTLSMIGDKVFTFKKTLLEAGLFDSLKVQFTAFDKLLSDNAEAINNVAKIIGDKLGFAVFQVADFFKNLNINMEDLIVGAKVAAAVLGGAGLLAVIKGITGAVKGLTLAMARNPLGLLAVAAASLITFLSMENGLGRTIAQVTAVMKTLGNLAGQIAVFFKEVLGKVVEFLTGAFDGFVDSVISGYNAIADFIPFLDRVEASGSDVRKALVDVGVKGFEFVEETVGNAKDAVVEFVDTNKLASDALNEARGILEQLTNSWTNAGITYDEATESQRKLYDETMAVAKAAEEQKNKIQEQALAAANATDKTEKLTEAQQKLKDSSFALGVTADIKKQQDEIIAFYDREIEKAKDKNEFIKVSNRTLYSREILLTDQKHDELLKLEENFFNKIDAMQKRSIERKLKNDLDYLEGAAANRDKDFLKRKGNEERTAEIVRDRINFEKKSELEKTQFGLEQATTMFTGLSKVNKKFFAAQKAAAIALAIVNTYQGATKALATYPPPFNFIAAAATVASGLAQVATIRAQTMQRGGALQGGQAAIIGEDGPELIVPKQSSTIIPREVADAIDGMGGKSQPVVVNFNISTVDAEGFDELLIRRRGTITGIINTALTKQGKQGVIG